MINFNNVNKFCCEDISLIENYEKAINDPEMWDCHHRLETQLNLSRTELIKQGKYYSRPAVELIFLTRSEHIKIHKEGEKNPMHGKKPEDFMTPEAIKEKRRKHSISMTGKLCGEKNPMYGRTGEKHPMYGRTGEKAYCYGHCWMTNGIDRIYPKKEDASKYIELGYQFGKKLK